MALGVSVREWCVCSALSELQLGQTPAAPCDPDGNKQYLAVKLTDGSFFSNTSLNWKDSSEIVYSVIIWGI